MQQFDIFLQGPKVDEGMIGLDRYRLHLSANGRMFQYFNHRALNLFEGITLGKAMMSRFLRRDRERTPERETKTQ